MPLTPKKSSVSTENSRLSISHELSQLTELELLVEVCYDFQHLSLLIMNSVCCFEDRGISM